MMGFVRRRLTYTNVALTIALVFAMAGGAYAAKKYVITSTKQISPKVLSALKGKAGAQGPAGPAGSQGPAGPTGPAGAAGIKGENGVNGKDGATGATGVTGPEGSPWTVGGTLPGGKSLKGEWNVSGYATEAGQTFRTSVSYGLPLAAGPFVHYIYPHEGEGEGKEAAAIIAGKCKGNVLEPQAAPGNLCVFSKEESNSLKKISILNFPAICDWELGAAEACLIGLEEKPGSQFGFGIVAGSEVAAFVEAEGTWAVTASVTVK